MLRILIVEDSRFFQKRLLEILTIPGRMEVVAIAENGLEGVNKSFELQPDVILMDVEMPIMNGIEAVKKIREKQSIPILMFSSLTREGAKYAIEALDAGASDFMLKELKEIVDQKSDLRNRLIEKLLNLGKKTYRLSSTPSYVSSNKEKMQNDVQTNSISKLNIVHKTKIIQPKNYDVIIIGSSTGGPAALNEIFQLLPDNLNVPIVVVQHMPAMFTQVFADRANAKSTLLIKEAKDGDLLAPGCIFIAEGGKNISFYKDTARIGLKILEKTAETHYIPSVDLAFSSAAQVFADNKVLAIVLTGMGDDGRQGAEKLKLRKATIWTQSESTCVIYGMPKAIDDANLSDLSIDLKDIVPSLKKALGI